MAARIRYLGNDVALRQGEFVIGRDPECALCLEDPIVSRRHAVLHVGAAGVFIEDLGSRNGALVNGAKILGRHRLSDGDSIVIGGQELVFFERGVTPTEPRKSNASGVDPFVGATTVGQSVSSSVHVPEAFEKVARVARNAFSGGRVAEAERTIERALAEILSLSRFGVDVGGVSVASAARWAATLAAATGKGRWVDYVFDLYTVRRQLMPVPISDLLTGAADTVRPDDLSTVTAYLTIARKLPKLGTGAAEAHGRVEELARRYGVG